MSNKNSFRKQVNKVYRKNQARFWGEALKPKPKWLPLWVYKKCLGFFLKGVE